MALQKLTYTDGITVIPASNLNAIQDAIIALENQQGASEISDDLKAALLQIASKVAYIDNQGQTYYNALYNALYPPKTLFSITAVFTQGSTVVYDNASLDSLKSMLVVTAHYTDGTSETVASNLYTLSGTLTVGTSTVTVSYNSKTTTFTVNVTAAPTVSSISAVYTQSGTVYDTDSLDSLKADLVVTAHYSDSSTQTVPAADYTLSGTLAAGTSTITVAYGGKTTTFSVTVTGYTWLYKASSGQLLSAQTYVTESTGGNGGTESLENGALRLHSDPHTGSISNFLRFSFSDASTTDGIIRAKVKMIDMSMSLADSGASGFRLQLSNGSTGAQAFFLNESGYITLVYYEGTTRKSATTVFPVNEYHVIEVKLSGGHQIISIDDSQIIDSSTLSNNYATANAILNQSAGSERQPNGVTTDIEWLGYLEV